jgi:hypothetical protein
MVQQMTVFSVVRAATVATQRSGTYNSAEMNPDKNNRRALFHYGLGQLITRVLS